MQYLTRVVVSTGSGLRWAGSIPVVTSQLAYTTDNNLHYSTIALWQLHYNVKITCEIDLIVFIIFNTLTISGRTLNRLKFDDNNTGKKKNKKKYIKLSYQYLSSWIKNGDMLFKYTFISNYIFFQTTGFNETWPVVTAKLTEYTRRVRSSVTE